MNYRYTQKDIKIIDMSNNEADFMYNWIRRHSGRVKMDDVTMDETNDSNTHLDVRGSNKNNNKENETNTNHNHIQSNEYSSKESGTK
jgi:hypothetical protein